MVSDVSVTPRGDSVASVDACLAAIDQQLSRQLAEVMHNESFRQLEAIWRSVEYLVARCHDDSSLMIEICSLSAKELQRDLMRASEVRASELYRRLYEEIRTDRPLSLVVGNYEFESTPRDIETLQRIAFVAEDLHVPFIAAASSQMFCVDQFDKIDSIRYIPKIFSRAEYAKWNLLRKSDEARYVFLTMPRVLIRGPYSSRGTQVEGFDYEELGDAGGTVKPLWGNGAFVLAAWVGKQFREFGWVGNSSCFEDGVVQAPAIHLTAEGNEFVQIGPLDYECSPHRESEVANKGFVPMVQLRQNDVVAFTNLPSVHKDEWPLGSVSEATHKLFRQLPYVLMACRITRYVEALFRHMPLSPHHVDLARLVNNWLGELVSDDSEISTEEEYRYPLRLASFRSNSKTDGTPSRSELHLILGYRFPQAAFPFRILISERSIQPSGV